MTLEYRCSNCGTLLQTTNADPLHDEIERLRAQLELSVKAREIERSEYQADLAIQRNQLVSAKKALEDINGAAVCNVLADPDELFQLLQHCAEVSDKALGDQSSAVESLANSQGGTGSTPVGRAQTDD